MSSDQTRSRNTFVPEHSRSSAAAAPRLAIQPFDTSFSFKNKAYAALKDVIVSMDIYRSRNDIRLDERQLAQDFGVSRTPVRSESVRRWSEARTTLCCRSTSLCPNV